MCKSKKKLTKEVINPKQRKSMSSSNASSSFNPQSPSSSTRSNENKKYISTSSNSSYNFKDASWQTSSITTPNRTPLSGLRESIILPEQPHIYDFAEIRAATNNFTTNPFSTSSSSTSWRCTIRNQTSVVIRRKFRRKMETSEVIDRLTHICRSHHASLIKLKGASISGNNIYLVYDYIQGATLAECLRNPRNPNFSVLSSWLSRAQIALDIAHGLDYIHNSTGLLDGFVHNHIKSTSIIITEPAFSAKICHFGTSLLCAEMVQTMSETNQESHKVDGKIEGTRGYMSPEYMITGISSQKSDVYAFGVVILELFSGNEALKYTFDEASKGYKRKSVIDSGREAIRGGEVRSWVDGRLRDSFPVEVADKMVALGLECVEEDPDLRPGMGKVVGRISQMYLESQKWAEKMGTSVDFTMSLGPR
ncbi:hypothetical protein LIER_01205 [Lithospermum erythrorhizon]|uniref:Protein kinase domain-containing protein n=1 Tax=Lithospermum erythrorhizon TaxID=34254 RepID=A0AAV3NK25_LITER